MEPLLKQIKSLTLLCQKLLCFIAYTGIGAEENIIEVFSQNDRLTKEIVKQALEELKRKEMCHMTFIYKRFGYTYRVSSLWFLPCIKYLLTMHQNWLNEFKAYKYRGHKVLYSLRNDTILLLEGSQTYTPTKIIITPESYEIINYLRPAAMNTQLYPLIEILPTEYLHQYWKSVIDMMFNADIVSEYDRLPELLASTKGLSDTNRKDIEARIALANYYAFGQYEPLPHNSSLCNHILCGIHALHNEEYKEAGEFLFKALALRNKDAEMKNIFMNFMTCYFLIAYYIKYPTTSNISKLKQFVKKKKINAYPSLWPSYILANWQTNETHSVNPKLLEELDKKGAIWENRAYRAITDFLSKSLGKDFDKRYSKPYIPQHAIFQHEFQRFLKLDEERIRELNQMFGQPVGKLDKVTLLDNIKTPRKALAVSKRIAYIIAKNTITVREQTKKEDGTWNAGTVVPPKMLKQGTLTSMDKIDHEICSDQNHASTKLSIDTTLPYLIGSNRVLTGERAPFREVKVEEVEPWVFIDRTEERLHIRTNLPTLDNNKKKYVVQKNETHYVVFRLDHTMIMVCKRLQTMNSLPLDAEENLKDSLHLISKKINIVSPIWRSSHAIQSITNSDVIVLQVRPLKGKMFEVTLGVKAAVNTKGIYSPGKGIEIYIDENDKGEQIQFVRNLEREKDKLRHINAFIQSLQEETADSGHSTDAEDMTLWTMDKSQLLATMSYVQRNTDTYFLEWPEGGMLHLKDISEAEQWNLVLRKEGRWIDIEGGVTIDKDNVISIGHLLQLMGYDGKKNYIQLDNNDFIFFTDAIRIGLTQLEGLSTIEKDKVRIPIVNAMLLNETLGGGIAVRNPEILHEIVEKIDASHDICPHVPTDLRVHLHPYQLDGFHQMYQLSSWGAGVCLSDETRGAETVQTIAMMLSKASEGPSLIIASNEVISNWRTEISRFAPTLRVVVLNEENAKARAQAVEDASAYDIVLLTYSLTSKEIKTLQGKNWNVFCLDATHIIHKGWTQTAQYIYDLKINIRIALTGTNIQDDLNDLWSVIHFTNPTILGSYQSFHKRFILPIEKGNKERQDLLDRIILPFILRRSKTEHIGELLPRTNIICPVTLGNEERYVYEYFHTKARQQFENEKGINMNLPALIKELRMAACASNLVNGSLNFHSRKLERMVQLLNEIDKENNRIVIFSQFTPFLKMIKDRLKYEHIDYLYLNEDSSIKEHNKIMQRFQNGEKNVIIISLKADRLGINLTDANYVIYMDLWWNTDKEQQIANRDYRIGERYEVTGFHLIATDTIEEKMMHLRQTKSKLAESLLEEMEAGHTPTKDDVLELLS